MPRTIIAAVIAAALLGPVAPAEAAPAATTFANCTAINAVYVGGIAKAGVQYDVVRSAGKVLHAALPDGVKVSTALHIANRRSDRDHDGIACEQH